MEGRYATALYCAAQKLNKLPLVESELGKIKTAILKSPGLQSFLRDPSHRREQKREAVLELLTKQNYSTTVINFFKTVAENGRLPQTDKIIDGFEEIVRAHRHEVPVKIISAVKLDQAAQETLRTGVVPRCLGHGQVPKMSFVVDPKIMGGIIVEVGDKTIDLSVSSKVALINKTLDESVYQ